MCYLIRSAYIGLTSPGSAYLAFVWSRNLRGRSLSIVNVEERVPELRRDAFASDFAGFVETRFGDA